MNGHLCGQSKGNTETENNRSQQFTFVCPLLTFRRCFRPNGGWRHHARIELKYHNSRKNYVLLKKFPHIGDTEAFGVCTYYHGYKKLNKS